MKCEVRNVESKETYEIPPEGAVFGRAGGPAGITISDQSVSKRHARIFKDNGIWFLEDMKSVNGTVVNNRRISEPLPVSPGLVFSLSKHRFEVVSVEGVAAPPARARSTGSPEQESNPRSSSRLTNSGASGRPRGNGAGGSAQPVPVPLGDAVSSSELSRAGDRAASGVGDAASGAGGRGSASAASVIAALPRGIGHYLIAIPRMMFMPRAAVRSELASPSRPAMGSFELAAFVLPAQLFAALSVPVAGSIGTALADGAVTVLSVLPAMALSVALVGSLVSGLVLPSVTAAVVDRMWKGRSDGVMRTNFVVMLQSGYAALMVPFAIAALLAPVTPTLAVSTPVASLLFLVPAVFTAIMVPLPAYIVAKWMERFDIKTAVRSALRVVFFCTAAGAVVKAGVDAVGAVESFMAPTNLTVRLADAPDGMRSPDAAAGVAAASDPPGATRSMASSAGVAASGPGPEVVVNPPDPGASPSPSPEPRAGDGRIATDAPPPNAANAGDAALDVPVDRVVRAPPGAVGGTEGLPASSLPLPSSPYREHAEKLKVVETIIADNPAILMEDARVAGLYKDFSRQKVSALVEADAAIPKGQRGELKFYLERYREAVIYKRTRQTVDQLHRLLTK